eukprot:scaffold1815_cov208-Amphora_coffeaeformis.AAC.3
MCVRDMISRAKRAISKAWPRRGSGKLEVATYVSPTVSTYIVQRGTSNARSRKELRHQGITTGRIRHEFAITSLIEYVKYDKGECNKDKRHGDQYSIHEGRVDFPSEPNRQSAVGRNVSLFFTHHLVQTMSGRRGKIGMLRQGQIHKVMQVSKSGLVVGIVGSQKVGLGTINAIRKDIIASIGNDH